MIRFRRGSRLLLWGTAVILAGLVYSFGRSLWFPAYVWCRGARTVADAIAEYGGEASERLLPTFERAGVAWKLFLV